VVLGYNCSWDFVNLVPWECFVNMGTDDFLSFGHASFFKSLFHKLLIQRGSVG
jgi:hypothetical protein